MLARIFKHGSGSGRRAIGYQQSELNHEGKERENPPELLRGDPEATAELIDSLEFKQKYTSGVLSFTTEEAARLEREPDLRLQLIDSFEHDFLAPDMDTDRLAIVWTQHREHGRTEFHFTVANVDLETGKRFPAYYDRADRTRLAAWQDCQNLSRGLDDPRAPERQRAVRHESELPKDKAQLAEALERLIIQKCLRGELEDRKAIVQFIESKDLRVGRQGRDYITVICGEGKNDRFRLKGALFHEDYRFDRTIRAGVNRSNSAGEADRARRAEQARIRLEAAMQFRRDYLEKRFGRRQERAFGRDHNLQERPEDHTRRGFESADGPNRDVEIRSSEMAAENDLGAQMGSNHARDRNIRSVHPGSYHDLVVDAQGAVERPHIAPEHEGRQDLSGDRRPGLDDVQRQRDSENASFTAMQDHRGGRLDVAAGKVEEERDEHPDKRTGRPSHGIFAAIERGISAARGTLDQAVQRVRNVIRAALEGAKRSASGTDAAIQHLDRAVRGSNETIGALERNIGDIAAYARTMNRGRSRTQPQRSVYNKAIVDAHAQSRERPGWGR